MCIFTLTGKALRPRGARLTVKTVIKRIVLTLSISLSQLNTAHAGDNTRFSFTAISMIAIIDSLEKQGYQVAIADSLLQQVHHFKILNVRASSIDELMEACAHQTGLTFRREGRVITISQEQTHAVVIEERMAPDNKVVVGYTGFGLLLLGALALLALVYRFLYRSFTSINNLVRLPEENYPLREFRESSLLLTASLITSAVVFISLIMLITAQWLQFNWLSGIISGLSSAVTALFLHKYKMARKDYKLDQFNREQREKEAEERMMRFAMDIQEDKTLERYNAIRSTNKQ